MSKKHFEAFAKAIKDRREAGIGTEVEAFAMEDLVIRIAEEFNPRFDRMRFQKACRKEAA